MERGSYHRLLRVHPLERAESRNEALDHEHLQQPGLVAHQPIQLLCCQILNLAVDVIHLTKIIQIFCKFYGVC